MEEIRAGEADERGRENGVNGGAVAGGDDDDVGMDCGWRWGLGGRRSTPRGERGPFEGNDSGETLQKSSRTPPTSFSILREPTPSHSGPAREPRRIHQGWDRPFHDPFTASANQSSSTATSEMMRGGHAYRCEIHQKPGVNRFSAENKYCGSETTYLPALIL